MAEHELDLVFMPALQYPRQHGAVRRSMETQAWKNETSGVVSEHEIASEVVQLSAYSSEDVS